MVKVGVCAFLIPLDLNFLVTSYLLRYFTLKGDSDSGMMLMGDSGSGVMALSEFDNSSIIRSRFPKLSALLSLLNDSPILILSLTA